MRVLVAGGSGQVGCELLRRAPNRGVDVVAPPRAELDVADFTSVSAIARAVAPDLIVNCAAYTAVDLAETESDAAFAVNRDGAENMARAAAAIDAPIVHISTDYLFDGHQSQAYDENAAAHPLNVYGESKLAGEIAVRDATPDHLILRTSWVYGIDGPNFVKTMLGLSEHQEIHVVTDQVGSPTFAADLAGAVFDLAPKLLADATPRGVFHCANEGQVDRFSFAREIFRRAERWLPNRPRVTEATSTEFPTAATRPAQSALSCEKLLRQFDLRMRRWDDALADMLARYFDEGSPA